METIFLGIWEILSQAAYNIRVLNLVDCGGQQDGVGEAFLPDETQTHESQGCIVRDLILLKFQFDGFVIYMSRGFSWVLHKPIELLRNHWPTPLEPLIFSSAAMENTNDGEPMCMRIGDILLKLRGRYPGPETTPPATGKQCACQGDQTDSCWQIFCCLMTHIWRSSGM